MVNKKKSCDGLVSVDENSPSHFSIDDCRKSDPAAGYRNGSSLNNQGENGNYWSSTPNESNTENAYNLNFNSSNHNVDWNNRNNGHTVRPVSELTPQVNSSGAVHHFTISREQLLKDLYRAYKDARKNKKGRSYQLKFEFNLEENLVQLCDALIERRYTPLPSTCFIIHDPKMREVFAANFRDRVVHHLFYNYTHELFERTFIYDSYSCIKNRGTHFGIERLKHHIRSESMGYKHECYVLKIDVKGYFMHIDRDILMNLCRKTLQTMRYHMANDGRKWGEILDYDFIDYLLEIIIYCNPLEYCNMLGDISEWDKLPHEKSLFYTPCNCGLPIGNLSSQLFSNIYMNAFDQYMKRELGCRHYGRYVDDAFVVSRDRTSLKKLIPRLNDFLRHNLKLSIHPHKTRIVNVRYGVEFLGAYLMPHRSYISNSSMYRIKRKLQNIKTSDTRHMQSSVNSFLGVMSHYDSYCLRRLIFGSNSRLLKCGQFSPDWLRFYPYADY